MGQRYQPYLRTRVRPNKYPIRLVTIGSIVQLLALVGTNFFNYICGELGKLDDDIIFNKLMILLSLLQIWDAMDKLLVDK